MTGAFQTSGVADLSASRSRLRVTGSDRVAFLHGQCTNDIKCLALGQSCYAAFLDAKGKMRGEGYILCREDAFLIECNNGLAPSLDKFIVTEDVVIEDASDKLGAWVVVGGARVELPPDAVAFEHALGTGVISAAPLRPTLSADELERLRIESGVPKWAVDMDDNTIPVEAGLAKRAINYDKGCYIGQETIARIKTYGHVNRHLVQIAIDSGPDSGPKSGTVSGQKSGGTGVRACRASNHAQAGTPAPPLPLRGAKIYAGDKQAGQVTSAAFSPRLGKSVALGYLRREFARPGSKLKINGQTAEVLKLCGE